MRTCFLAVVLAACSSGSKPVTAPVPAPDPTPTPTPHPPPEPHVDREPAKMSLAQSGIVPSWIDKGADPCGDFFAYACGSFVKTAQIPPDRSSWGAIQIVVKDNEDFMRDVLEHAAKDPGSDPVNQKIGAYYAACMDEAAIEKAGIAPIQPLLDEVGKVKDAATATHAVIALQAEDINPFFGVDQQQDYADATQVIGELDQAGLGLPDRKYYLESKGTMAKTRTTYREHMVRMFQLLGDDAKTAKARADRAYALEERIAKKQQDEVVRRNPHAIYHPTTVEKLGAPWTDLFAAFSLPKTTKVNVNDPAYYTEIAKILKTEKPQTLRDYLTWNIIRDSASDLTKAWVDEDFTMKKELSGVKELPPRWRRCVHHVDREIGELLGQSYVKARFAGDSKARAVDLTKSVLAAMGVELDHLDWMDQPTRDAAKKKLEKMAYLVGYPDKWREYTFEVSRTDFAKNVRAASLFELHRRLAKIGKPVDRFDWQMTPPTVNAYYEPTLNELALPAGQLQAPFYGATFHPAVNFGDTGGGTIGHEMTHGFDDEGKEFDADGNMKDWWTKATKDKFVAATKCIQTQYAQYEAVPGVKLDGELTSGENIADNGGVKLAYEAYKSWRGKHPDVPREVDGYSDDQLYYLAYAQSWCDKETPELLEAMAHTNPHSPAKWRVNGVIVNQPGFGPAFKCTAGTAMNPGKTCGVW
jgi:predicted metalloendopeptidase